MRSSLVIFLIGLVLGSTLGIGGVWTQVVQPAYTEIKELSDEQEIMQGALQEAETTIEEVAASLRNEAATPVSRGNVTGTSPAPATQPKLADPDVLAERLDKLRLRVKKARGGEKP
jgi:hypothetical protein